MSGAVLFGGIRDGEVVEGVTTPVLVSTYIEDGELVNVVYYRSHEVSGDLVVYELREIVDRRLASRDG